MPFGGGIDLTLTGKYLGAIHNMIATDPDGVVTILDNKHTFAPSLAFQGQVCDVGCLQHFLLLFSPFFNTSLLRT
jgi:hypothetical protein